MKSGTQEQWFWKKVAKGGPDDCWNWTAAKSPRGYGVFGSSAQRAHRISWEWANGPIPDGMVVRHSCDNPTCVNPKHLLLGTQADNMADRQSRKRTARCENAGPAKLSNADVERIREMYLFGAKCSDMAATFGVTRETIGNVVKRRTFVSLGV